MLGIGLGKGRVQIKYMLEILKDRDSLGETGVDDFWLQVSPLKLEVHLPVTSVELRHCTAVLVTGVLGRM